MKLVILFSVLFLASSLVGCGSSKNNDGAPGEVQSNSNENTVLAVRSCEQEGGNGEGFQEFALLQGSFETEEAVRDAVASADWGDIDDLPDGGDLIAFEEAQAADMNQANSSQQTQSSNTSGNNGQQEIEGSFSIRENYDYPYEAYEFRVEIQQQRRATGPTTRPANPGGRPQQPNYRPQNPPGARPGNPPGYRPPNPPGARPGNPPGRGPNNPPGYRPPNPPGARPGNPPGRDPGYRPGRPGTRPPSYRPPRPPGYRPPRPPGYRPPYYRPGRPINPIYRPPVYRPGWRPYRRYTRWRAFTYVPPVRVYYGFNTCGSATIYIGNSCYLPYTPDASYTWNSEWGYSEEPVQSTQGNGTYNCFVRFFM